MLMPNVPPPLAPLTNVPPPLTDVPPPLTDVLAVPVVAEDAPKKRKDPGPGSLEPAPAAKRVKEVKGEGESGQGKTQVGTPASAPSLGSKPSIKLKLKPSTATPVQVRLVTCSLHKPAPCHDRTR